MAISNKYLSMFIICVLFSLFDPYSFDISLNLGLGPNFRIIDVLFVLGFIAFIRQGNIPQSRKPIVALILVWILWGWFSIIRGSFEHGLTVAITESKAYTIVPIFMMILYALFTKYPDSFKNFCHYFMNYGVIIVIISFLLGIGYLVLTGQNKLISLLEYLDPKRYDLMEWNMDDPWARFLNAYTALFLAISVPVLVVGKYVFNKDIKISKTTIFLSVIAMILGQVRTAWAVSFFALAFSLFTFIIYSRYKKNVLKMLLFVCLSLGLGAKVIVSLNDRGYINLEQSLTPVKEGFSETHTFSWRESIWIIALAKWSAQPVLGLGYGGYYESPLGGEVWAPHSSYVAVLVKQGIIGITLMILFFLILLVYYLKSYFRGANGNIKYGGFIGVITIIATFIFAYSYETTLIQWVFLSISLYYIDIGENERGLAKNG